MENPTSNICNKIHTQKLKCICDLVKPKLLYCKQWHSFKQSNNIHAYYLWEITTVRPKHPTDQREKRSATYKVVCCEGNMIQEVHLKLLSDQWSSIGIPIQPCFFTKEDFKKHNTKGKYLNEVEELNTNK